MKRSNLPKSINPVQLVAQRAHLEGELPLRECERLSALLRESTGRVDFSLQFMQDETTRAVIQVQARAALILECRRCLQPLAYPVEIAVTLAIVPDNAAAAELPEHYEPLVFTEGELALASLVEDELLLSLPVLHSHPEGECAVALPTSWVEDEPVEQKNPFTVLKKLLRSDRNGST